MTQTEQWVSVACESIMASGHVRLYHDLYKDLRERLPCGVACRLIAQGLERTRLVYFPATPYTIGAKLAARAQAIAALKRLGRYAERCEHDAHCASINNPSWAV